MSNNDSQTKAKMVKGVVASDTLRHGGKELKQGEPIEATEAQMKVYRQHKFVKGNE